MVSLTADEERGFWSRSSGNELRGAASYFIIVAPVPKWDGVEKLINRSVMGLLPHRKMLPEGSLKRK
jgi:hypothetical protein